jgi:phospholipase/carboxylesterase
MHDIGTCVTRRTVLGVLVCVCLLGCTGQSELPAQSEQASKLGHTAPPKPSPQPERPDNLLDYIEVLTGAAQAEDTLPLVVFIHGLGGRPESLIPFVEVFGEKARVILPRAPTPWGRGYAWFGRSQNKNRSPLSDGMADSAKRIANLLSYLAETKPTRGRPILAGFSQGGMLSYAVATSHPQTIGLAIPISGLLPKPLWPKEIGDAASYPRIRALHGKADNIVPINDARDTVSHLKQVGLDATLLEYPLVPHTISRAMQRQVVDLVGREIRKQR